MKIRELSITNFLSFGDNGLNRNASIQLSDFNLFIGSNNAGKSNVLKLMWLLKAIIRSIVSHGNDPLENFPLFTEEHLHSYDDWVFSREKDRRNIAFSFSLEICESDTSIKKLFDGYDSGRDYHNPVLLLFNQKKEYPKTIKISGIITHEQVNPLVTVTKLEIPNDHSTYARHPLMDRPSGTAFVLRQDQQREVWKAATNLSSDEMRKRISRIGQGIKSFLNTAYGPVIDSLFVEIRAIREIEPLGDEIVEALGRLSNGTPEQIEVYERILNYIRSLVFVDEKQDIRFVYPEEGGKRSIKIQVGRLQLPLSHYGSGVEQMLALAAQIVRQGTNKVVLIEEPEAHFYPALQRRFVRFLRDSQETFAHQYLIATHSNIFIDEFVKIGGEIFYVHSEQESTTATKHSEVDILDQQNMLHLFRDLGVRPSDLLFANGILVVEGPIDKDVLSDWARKMGKPFGEVSILVLDVEGAGNIKKYLLSDVIRRTCFSRFALHDKNDEGTVRNAVEGIVPEENIIGLKKGDIEDYYPREIVIDFARELALKKGIMEGDIPKEIKEGKTVQELNELLGGDWWKRSLSERVISEMRADQVDHEIRSTLAHIQEGLC